MKIVPYLYMKIMKGKIRARHRIYDSPLYMNFRAYYVQTRIGRVSTYIKDLAYEKNYRFWQKLLYRSSLYPFKRQLLIPAVAISGFLWGYAFISHMYNGNMYENGHRASNLEPMDYTVHGMQEYC